MERLNDERWVVVPVEKLVKADWNYKKEDEATAESLAANFKRNGQIENILIRELPTGFYEVVNGNHRLDTLNALGIEKAICFNFGKISDAQARRIAVETNETKFDRDNVKLADLIKEITDIDVGEFDIDELATTMPFSTDDLKGMVDLVDWDWTQIKDPGEPEKKKDDEKDKNAAGISMHMSVVCPKCSHEFSVRNEDGDKK